MASCNPRSFFQDINSRELNGFRVRKRPYISNDRPAYEEIGAVAIEHNGYSTPPMALSFSKTNKNSLLAVTDEDGFISLYNTRSKLSSSSTHQQNTERSRVSEWVAHENAIFDICWIKEDTTLLSASGDQSIKVWDAQEKDCIRVLVGHTGSVKSITSHPVNHDIILSGSRDGSFALWDLRCDKVSHQKLCIQPDATIHEAHTHPSQRQVRRGRGKAASMSITSVLYLKDEISIATAGAVDSVVKFWDSRNLKSPVIQASPQLESSNVKERRHGISWLSQDMNGMFISASCMDNRIYLYNVLQLEKGPVKTFSGSRTESFFVKSAISPDAAHILSGSSDGYAYIWQVQKPHEDPVMLKGHDGEVTAVDWCPSDIGKVATSSDDFTVRLWDIQSSCYSNTRSPSSIRKRVTALPKMQRRKLFTDENLTCLKNESESYSEDVTYNVNSPTPTPAPAPTREFNTPEAQKKKVSLSFEVTEGLEKSPEATTGSPSSVLSPPSSLKRKTIRDYFTSAS